MSLKSIGKVFGVVTVATVFVLALVVSTEKILNL